MPSSMPVLGPGNYANAAMGLALHLFITNLGGGVTGNNMMSVVDNISTWPFMFAEFELSSGAAIIISPKRAEILKAQGYSKQGVADYLR